MNMKKILISLLVLFTVLVSVSCGDDKPAPKYEIEITEKLTSIDWEYHFSNNEYVSIAHYRFRYHYKTVYPDGATDKRKYAEGDEIKDVSYTAYEKYDVGDKFIADSYVFFSFPY